MAVSLSFSESDIMIDIEGLTTRYISMTETRFEVLTCRSQFSTRAIDTRPSSISTTQTPAHSLSPLQHQHFPTLHCPTNHASTLLDFGLRVWCELRHARSIRRPWFEEENCRCRPSKTRKLEYGCPLPGESFTFPNSDTYSLD